MPCKASVVDAAGLVQAPAVGCRVAVVRDPVVAGGRARLDPGFDAEIIGEVGHHGGDPIGPTLEKLERKHAGSMSRGGGRDIRGPKRRADHSQVPGSGAVASAGHVSAIARAGIVFTEAVISDRGYVGPRRRGETA